jgi:hypothetical protein
VGSSFQPGSAPSQGATLNVDTGPAHAPPPTATPTACPLLLLSSLDQSARDYFTIVRNKNKKLFFDLKIKRFQCLTAVKDVLEVMSVEDFHERQIVILLVREGDDEEDVLVLVELVADRRRQVGLPIIEQLLHFH